MEFSLLLPLVNFKADCLKHRKVVSWIFDVTSDALLLAVTQKNSITRHLFTLYGGRFSVNHDVVRIWVMLKIKGKYKQQQKNTNC